MLFKYVVQCYSNVALFKTMLFPFKQCYSNVVHLNNAIQM